MRKTSFILFLAAIALVALASHSVDAQSSRLVVATGLDNPRGLAFGPDGSLYVAEAGRGGNSAICQPAGGAPPTAPPECYGPTGAITRIVGQGDQRRVAVGLPSLANPTGSDAVGPHDVSFGLGAMWVTVGLGNNPANRAPFEAAGVRLGRLVRVESNGSWTEVLDLSAHEAANNPDGGAIDSNPYGLQMLSDGAVFTDAGANAVVRIAANGALSTLAVFPNRFVPFAGGQIPMQAVPTTVTQAPDGSFYVGQLTGFPFPVGGANVYSVPANGGTPVAVAGGFTNIIDIAVAPTGGGYVLEHDADGITGPGTAGRLIRINADGTTTVMTNANLTKPGGVAVGPDGAIYVTNNSNSAGVGEVVRLTP